MTTSITTFLTHDPRAEEAAKLHTSLFAWQIGQTMHYPAGGPRPACFVLARLQAAFDGVR